MTSPDSITLEQLSRVLQHPRQPVIPTTYRLQMRTEQGEVLDRLHAAPPGARPQAAAVLVLLYPGLDGPALVLTRRTAHLKKHAGQISFPGGRIDPTDPSHLETALRETREELGISTDNLLFLTELSPVFISPSNFLVRPFVMMSMERPDFQPNPNEVDEVLEVPLALLLREETVETEVRELAGGRFVVPYFRVGPHKVWGATAAMLGELVSRLESGLALE